MTCDLRIEIKKPRDLDSSHETERRGARRGQKEGRRYNYEDSFFQGMGFFSMALSPQPSLSSSLEGEDDNDATVLGRKSSSWYDDSWSFNSLGICGLLFLHICHTCDIFGKEKKEKRRAHYGFLPTSCNTTVSRSRKT